MTIAEQLEQKGFQKGFLLGFQQGFREGYRQGQLKVARAMLQNDFDRNSVMQMTGLTEDDLSQIHH